MKIVEIKIGHNGVISSVHEKRPKELVVFHACEPEVNSFNTVKI